MNERIVEAAHKASRAPADITLLLATKTRTPEVINEAIRLGYGLIGENRAQELVEKAPFLIPASMPTSNKEIADITQQSISAEAISYVTPRETHFIGALQGNKVNEVTKLADCIQSVDRLRIARRIHQYALDNHLQKRILIQVNSSLDPNKQGVLPDELPQFLEDIASFSTLKIEGLMTIGLQTEDEKLIRQGFADLRILSEKMRTQGLLPADATTLSMGMSGDLELAILEGSTLLRVGSDIFGAR
ncbi:YggS family pyridoxal phosphate-dependent enzyme [Ignatzschineria ureiclastica]|uniref:Pyridoxal phosphate homeostasis protein n=1 Tax=Ignatzschineria ureiclastica TaxID=472582 RepID=A0A2U2AEG1_9GAMM|nr:YggS family pyridoxal phosphate-dependent enzyme [Ignatzschineria ureiclastica]